MFSVRSAGAFSEIMDRRAGTFRIEMIILLLAFDGSDRIGTGATLFDVLQNVVIVLY